MGTGPLETGELIAKHRFKEAAAKEREDFGNRYIVRAARQPIPPGLSSNTLHEFAPTEKPHQLGDIGNGEGFSLPDFGNSHTVAFAGTRNAKKTSQPVLFLCTQFHIAYIIPNSSFAVSDIFSGFHGGSQTTSTSAL